MEEAGLAFDVCNMRICSFSSNRVLKNARKLSKRAKRKNIKNFLKKVLTGKFGNDRIIITLLRGERKKARDTAAKQDLEN